MNKYQTLGYKLIKVWTAPLRIKVHFKLDLIF